MYVLQTCVSSMCIPRCAPCFLFVGLARRRVLRFRLEVGVKQTALSPFESPLQHCRSPEQALPSRRWYIHNSERMSERRVDVVDGLFMPLVLAQRPWRLDPGARGRGWLVHRAIRRWRLAAPLYISTGHRLPIQGSWDTWENHNNLPLVNIFNSPYFNVLDPI